MHGLGLISAEQLFTEPLPLHEQFNLTARPEPVVHASCPAGTTVHVRCPNSGSKICFRHHTALEGLLRAWSAACSDIVHIRRCRNASCGIKQAESAVSAKRTLKPRLNGVSVSFFRRPPKSFKSDDMLQSRKL